MKPVHLDGKEDVSALGWNLGRNGHYELFGFRASQKRRDTLSASAKQWTVVIALSFVLGGMPTMTGHYVTGQTLQNEDSTQNGLPSLTSRDGAVGGTAGKSPVARLMMGNDSSTSAAQQTMLDARRSLATGDLATAKSHLKKLAGMPAAESRDYVASIEAMIGRHEQLVSQAKDGDPVRYNQNAAAFLLEQADGLLRFGDFQAAESLATSAQAFNAKYDAGAMTPQQLLQKVAAAKSATPASIAQTRDQAKRLISELQLSLDQGRLDQANEKMAQLKSMHLMDSMFAAQDVRPWQLELQLQAKLAEQQATRSATVALAAAEKAIDGDAGQGLVRTAGFSPESDQSKVVLASADALPALQYEQSQDGIELYLRGVQALNSGNRQMATELLNKAWDKRDTLDGAVRVALEQKMAFLKNSVPAITASSTGMSRDEPNTAPDMDAQNQLLMQKMRQHVLRQRAEADKLMAQQKPRNAVNVLQTLRAEVEQSDIDAAPKAQLIGNVDREIERLDQFMQQHKVEIETAEANSTRMEDVLADRETRYATENKVALMVEEFNQLQAQERFSEASVIARQAESLAPENPAVISMVQKAMIKERVYEQEQLARLKEETNYATWTDVERSSAMLHPDTPFAFGSPRDWTVLSETRRGAAEARSIADPAEYRIRQLLLNHKVQLSFNETPFTQAITMLAQDAGVNIAFDARGLAAENVDTATPISFSLPAGPISLQSALNVILSQYNLDYVIEDEIIKITSRANKQPKLINNSIYVGDLVHPIPNFQGINPVTIMSSGGVIAAGGMGANGQLGSSGQMLAMGGTTTGPITMNNSSAPTSVNPMVLAQQLSPDLMGSSYASTSNTPTVNPLTGMGGQVQADFQSLINLIQTTINPESWEENGGPVGATITPFNNTNSLVIRNTQEVHDQIQSLLKRLRELQDVQIVIETRFISLSDSFFERIGVDFDFQLNDFSNVDSGNFGDTRPESAIVGRLGAADLTLPADLDIPFTQDSFAESVPQFGGFGGGATAANFGFAILSDIEVFFLIQAAKGDQRSNVMVAPKITLFNGQFGSVTDVTQRSFVTGVTPIVGSFAAAHAPVISTLAEGTMMSVQAVVTNDRRFVRLTLVPTFTRLNGVDEFTFSGSTSTNTGSSIFDPSDGSIINQNRTTETAGVTVQQPIFSITSVSATVAVPDGGTVLLGGVKRLNEARVERGVPFLSNLPYINRLFKNVGIGRDTSSVMLMVTPRVIIKEEEEARQVGITP